MTATEEVPAPCPWCGGEAKSLGFTEGRYFVQCFGTCEATGPVSAGHDEAIRAWNKVAKGREG